MNEVSLEAPNFCVKAALGAQPVAIASKKVASGRQELCCNRVSQPNLSVLYRPVLSLQLLPSTHGFAVGNNSATGTSEAGELTPPKTGGKTTETGVSGASTTVSREGVTTTVAKNEDGSTTTVIDSPGGRTTVWDDGKGHKTTIVDEKDTSKTLSPTPTMAKAIRRRQQ